MLKNDDLFLFLTLTLTLTLTLAALWQAGWSGFSPAALLHTAAATPQPPPFLKSANSSRTGLRWSWGEADGRCVPNSRGLGYGIGLGDHVRTALNFMIRLVLEAWVTPLVLTSESVSGGAWKAG